VEKSRKNFQVASLGAGEIYNRPGSKKQTKHRAEPVKRYVDPCMAATGRIRCGQLDHV